MFKMLIKTLMILLFNTPAQSFDYFGHNKVFEIAARKNIVWFLFIVYIFLN